MTVPPVHAPALLRDKDALSSRWQSVHAALVLDGVAEDRARTEAARIGALEAWEMINEWRRRERAIGSATAARVLERALRHLQDIVILVLRSPGDLATAADAMQAARRSFASSNGEEGSLRDGAGAAITATEEAFSSLEELLCAPHAQSA